MVEAMNEEESVVEHSLKCWPEFFSAIARGDKRHDLRRSDDRVFHVGDRLRLNEFDPIAGQYTGRHQVVLVTYITSSAQPCALSGKALAAEYSILSIEPVRNWDEQSRPQSYQLPNMPPLPSTINRGERQALAYRAMVGKTDKLEP